MKENIVTKKEEISILETNSIIHLPQNTSDLITALEDSILIGVYKIENENTFYSKHRKTVEGKISNE